MHSPLFIMPIAVASLLMDVQSYNLTSGGLSANVYSQKHPLADEERLPVDVVEETAIDGAMMLARVTGTPAAEMASESAAKAAEEAVSNSGVRAFKKQTTAQLDLPELVNLDNSPSQNIFRDYIDKKKLANENNKDSKDTFKSWIDRQPQESSTAFFDKIKAEDAKKAPVHKIADLVKWLYEKQEPKVVFDNLLKLYPMKPKFTKIGSTVLSSTAFKKLMKYIEWFNIGYHQEQTTFYDTLRIFYKNQKKWNQTIEAGKLIESSKVVALRLQWLDEKKYPANILAEWQQEAKNKLVGNQKFKDWYMYTAKYNMKNPTNGKKLSDILDTFFKKKGLADEIETMLEDDVAAVTQKELDETNTKYDPVKYFEDLKKELNPLTFNYFTMEGMPTWVAYVDDFAIKYLDEKKPLSFYCSGNEKELIDMAYAAFTKPHAYGSFSDTVLKEIGKDWLQSGLTPISILLVDLELGNSSGLFINPCFYEWIYFVDAYNALNKGKEVSIAQILMDAFDKDNQKSLLPAFENIERVSLLQRLINELMNLKNANDNKYDAGYIEDYIERLRYLKWKISHEASANSEGPSSKRRKIASS